MESAEAAEKQCGTDKLSEDDRALGKLYKSCGDIYINEKVLTMCLVDIRRYIDLPRLKDHLLKHKVILMEQFHEITNPQHSSNVQVDNLLKYVGCAGGRHGYFLFYVSLYESSSEGHRGHKCIVDELQRKAREMKVCTPENVVHACCILDREHTSDSSVEADVEESGYESNKEILIYKCTCGGDCTLRDYMLDTKCPQSAKNAYPLLNLPSDSYEAQQLEAALRKQSNIISDEFVDLAVNTFEALSETAFEDVQRYTNHLVSTGNYDNEVFGHQPIANCITATTCHKELENVLMNNYYSWFNYTMIRKLRKKFIIKDREDELLQSYEEKFSHYCRRRCFECQKSFHPKPVSANLRSLVFKIDENFGDFNLLQVSEIRATVESIINTPDHAIYVRSVNEGCVEVSCYILPQFEVGSLNQVQIAQLKDHNIFSFIMEGKELMPPLHGESSIESDGYDASSEEECDSGDFSRRISEKDPYVHDSRKFSSSNKLRSEPDFKEVLPEEHQDRHLHSKGATLFPYQETRRSCEQAKSPGDANYSNDENSTSIDTSEEMVKGVVSTVSSPEMKENTPPLQQSKSGHIIWWVIAMLMVILCSTAICVGVVYILSATSISTLEESKENINDVKIDQNRPQSYGSFLPILDESSNVSVSWIKYLQYHQNMFIDPCSRLQELLLKPLNTTDVQSVEAVFFRNFLFLRCSFADNSEARGCIVNLILSTTNGTEWFEVAHQGSSDSMCTTANNQCEVYGSMVVHNWEVDGRDGKVTLNITHRVINTTSLEWYRELNGCREVAEPNRTALIVGEDTIIIVVIVFMMFFALYFYIMFRIFTGRRKPLFFCIAIIILLSATSISTHREQSECPIVEVHGSTKWFQFQFQFSIKIGYSLRLKLFSLNVHVVNRIELEECTEKINYVKIDQNRPQSYGTYLTVMFFKPSHFLVSWIKYFQYHQNMFISRLQELKLLKPFSNKTLSQTLKHSQQLLSYCVSKLYICHTVALAPDYLHSMKVINRERSSNNLLIIGVRRTKVTDVSRSKTADTLPTITLLDMLAFDSVRRKHLNTSSDGIYIVRSSPILRHLPDRSTLDVDIKINQDNMGDLNIYVGRRTCFSASTSVSFDVSLSALPMTTEATPENVTTTPVTTDDVGSTGSPSNGPATLIGAIVVLVLSGVIIVIIVAEVVVVAVKPAVCLSHHGNGHDHVENSPSSPHLSPNVKLPLEGSSESGGDTHTGADTNYHIMQSHYHILMRAEEDPSRPGGSSLKCARLIHGKLKEIRDIGSIYDADGQNGRRNRIHSQTFLKEIKKKAREVTRNVAIDNGKLKRDKVRSENEETMILIKQDGNANRKDINRGNEDLQTDLRALGHAIHAANAKVDSVEPALWQDP